MKEFLIDRVYIPIGIGGEEGGWRSADSESAGWWVQG